MKMITFLLRRSRKVVVFAIATGVVSGACSTGLLALITALLGHTVSRSTLLIAFLGLCVLVLLTRVVSELLLTFLGQETIFQLRLDLSRRVLEVPLRRLEELGPHRVLATLTEDIPTITQVVSLIPNLAVNLAIVVGCLIYLGLLSVKVFAGVVLLMALGVVGYQLPLGRAVAHMVGARKVNDDLYGHFRTLTQGIKELKLHRLRREGFLVDELTATARSFRDENIRGMRIYTIAASWGQVFVFVVIGLLLFVLPEMERLPPAVLTGYVLTVLYLMTPLQVLMNSAQNFGRAGAAMDRIDAMGVELAANSAQESRETALPGGSPRLIELQGITHSYRREGEEGEFVLGPIDLTISPGELLLIAGGNGSGKTTLAKLLVGLYAPASGRILCDGREVVEENRDAYRQSFSVVFSDFHLFTTLLGIEGEEIDARAHGYLQTLQLQHKVEVKGGQLSTLDLSQGQRKRLALLTAYLEDRPVYLFDEWAADQDPFFKEIFYRQLLPELKRRGKAVIVISHDDRYYDVADRVLKLESGRIVSVETQVPVEA